MAEDKTDAEWISIPVSRGQARLTLTLLFAAIVGGVGYPVVSLVTPARHDPFTGADGKALERRLSALEEAVREHNKSAEQWKYRIIELESRYGRATQGNH